MQWHITMTSESWKKVKLHSVYQISSHLNGGKAVTWKLLRSRFLSLNQPVPPMTILKEQWFLLLLLHPACSSIFVSILFIGFFSLDNLKRASQSFLPGLFLHFYSRVQTVVEFFWLIKKKKKRGNYQITP